jgi:hypothetical protein
VLLPSLVVLLVASNFELECLHALRVKVVVPQFNLSPPLHDAVRRRSEKLSSPLLGPWNWIAG